MESRRLIMLTGIVLVLLVLVTLLLISTAQGAPEAQAADAPVSAISKQTTQQVLDFWTPERMASARPVPMPNPKPNNLGGQRPTTTLGVIGPAMVADGNAPGQVPSGGAKQLSLAVTPSPVVDYFSYPFPYDRTGVNPNSLYTTYPWKTNGKLYFTNAGYGPGTWVCSGTSVTSGSGGNRRLVLTAAHCLNSGGTAGGATGTWSDNLLFVPGRMNGTNPNGSWGWSSEWVLNSWHTQSNMRRDYGFIVTADNASGRLGDVVGTQGLAWNQSRVQQWWDFGYPRAFPFNGERMILCTSSIGRDDTWATGFGALPIGIGCDMTGGSSGGGWIIGAKMATWGYANSVNSYKYTSPSQPEAMYGPYFDGNLGNLWNGARR